MPPRKSKLQLRNASDLGLSVIQGNRNTEANDEHVATVQGELKAVQARVTELERTTSELTDENEQLESLNRQLHSTISGLKSSLAELQVQKAEVYRRWRTAHQRCTRQEKRISKLTDRLKEVDAAHGKEIRSMSVDYNRVVMLKGQLEDDKKKLSDRLELMEYLGRSAEEKQTATLALINSKLADARKKVSMLKKRDDRAVSMLERTVQRTTQTTLARARTFHLLEKGVYTEAVRDVVRYLFRVGVPGYRMNDVIHRVGELLGVHIIGNISRTSFARFIREGGIAAKVQIGYELSMTDGFTLSSDGTSHRAVNYNSRHANLKAENYTTGEVGRQTRFLGVMPSLDASSAESIKDYDRVLGGVCDLFSRSPLARRTRLNPLRIVDVLAKLVGLQSDHCAKEKKDAKALQQRKEESVHQILGEQEVVNADEAYLLPYFTKERKKMLKGLGGEEAWDMLSEVEQANRNAEMLHSIVMELGKESLELMSPDEKRILKLFIWAGCGCHKELNTVRGGYAAMVKYYSEHDTIPQPILLANRDNAPVLKDITSEEDIENEVQARAFEMTGSGGIKCAQLAGAVFNNKLDKKGHHDLFRWWWKDVVKSTFTFPDTSNTRFGSYCEAAIELIVHLDHFKAFLRFIEENKRTHRWSHMEQNLWNALHDAPTLSELLVLGLYSETAGKPYMALIRAHAQKRDNMLMLGPLHEDVYKHLRILFNDPVQLLSGDIDVLNLTAVLYGQEWQRPDFIKVVHSMAPNHPHLCSLLRAFFDGASATWKRFTSEFAPGGLIDEASMEERELAWMLPTNDVNEGALGAFRVMMRRQPQLSLSGYNAQAMYFHNDTQAFVKKYFVEPADLQFVRHMARESSGDDRKREQEIMEHSRQRAAEGVARREKRQQRAQEKELRLAKTNLVLDETKLPGLKGDPLKDMLDKFKAAGAFNLEAVKRNSKVQVIRDALAAAIGDYNDGTWKIGGEEEDEEDELSDPGDSQPSAFEPLSDWEETDSED